jgi:hypothetical protein
MERRLYHDDKIETMIKKLVLPLQGGGQGKFFHEPETVIPPLAGNRVCAHFPLTTHGHFNKF